MPKNLEGKPRSIRSILEVRINKFLDRLSVARTVLLSFVTLIFIGSFALFYSSEGELTYVDSLYLAASAVCVTGLSPVNLSELNTISHWVIMILIQLGGLGIITFTVIIGILIVRGESRNMKFNRLVKEAIDSTDHKKVESSYNSMEVRRVLFSVINISFSIEAVGTFLIYNYFPETLPEGVDRFFFSLFTSISAFNNAGFSIVDDLSLIQSHIPGLYIVSGLVILGGIGFPVIIYVEKIILKAIQQFLFRMEAVLETNYYSSIINHPERTELPKIYPIIMKFSFKLENKLESYKDHLHGESNRIQYKILFYGTIFLLVFGTLFIYILESANPHTFYGMEPGVKVANAFFISVCARTAGFATLDLSGINDPTIVFICLLMFIGGGPQGTAGGVKITTFTILLVYLKNVINPSLKVQIFGETISKNSVAISIRVYFLATVSIAFMFMVLAILNQNENSLHIIFFELISSFSTVGFSLGLTSSLGVLEKLFYCLVMIVGRIGIFTVLIAITGHSGVPSMGEDEDSVKIQVG